ncbi:hypothetical protein ENSA5_29560 [Enhygromyxa salina]|uniref:Imm33-like domain-containing protein n=1 Tax=Enhygromyxa salina TaxID=215803 RepID=A0A2S9Y1D8_9BACT|nr:hypothetical protein [Enhygromyxa salina]PRP98800.1 hypothetical protein ENSA5_29560 [Enhygromyxa salina]
MRLWFGLAAGVSILLGPGCGPERSTATPDADPNPAVVTEFDQPQPTREGEHTFAYGPQTIYVYADPSLDREVERLLLLFEDLRAESVPITAKTRIPIGWTTLSFALDGERLVVEEPDYDNEPESRTRPDISVSLATLARQRAVLEQVGIPGQAIEFDQHVLTIRGVLERDEVMLVRVESPGGRLTGWRLTPAEGIEEADEIESLPVYAILAARPELLDAMLLPPGYLVLYAGKQLTTIVNEANEIVWDWTVDGELPRDGDAALGGGFVTDESEGRERPRPLLEPLE